MTLQQGDTAEDFELLAHDGKPITLSSYKNTKNVVLCFYPKNHLFACPSKKVFEMAKSVISVYPEITATDTVVFYSDDLHVPEVPTSSDHSPLPINREYPPYSDLASQLSSRCAPS